MSRDLVKPVGEQDRLAALRSYNILDTPPEAGFDDIAMLARVICRSPIALVSFVDSDRQWFKAAEGFAEQETPIDQSVCRHALAASTTLVMPDLTLDPRTRHNTLVTGRPFMRFYAGAVLCSPEGFPLGTVCVIDTKPRPAGLTAEQIAALEALARQVMALLEMRRTVTASEQITTQQRRVISDTVARADASDRVADGLRLSEGRMRLAQEAGHVGSFDLDMATDTLIVTEQFCEIFGIAAVPAIPSAEVEAMVHADDRTQMSDRARRNDGSAPLNVEYRIRHGATGEWRWIARRGQFVVGDDGKPQRLLGTVQDITDRKTVDERQTILNQELSHRLKNTLALVQAIARQTLRNAADRESVRAFEDRVNALSRGHEILLKQSWSAADLGDLIAGILAMHGDSNRFHIAGPATTLGSRAALSFSLLLHELCTNAQKYGALSAPAGHVDVTWDVVDANLTFRWIERGGPVVVPPTRTGLGSRLIDMGLVGTSNTMKNYNPSGLEVSITAPMASVQDQSN